MWRDGEERGSGVVVGKAFDWNNEGRVSLGWRVSRQVGLL